MLVDANVLIYAVDPGNQFHERAHDWVSTALNGDRRIGLPWKTIGAFVRITTHPRLSTTPLTGPEAWSFVQEWLDSPLTWIPAAGERTAAVLRVLIEAHQLSANAIPDAQLAALAIEHGLEVVSADSDFARFPAVRWVNPFG